MKQEKNTEAAFKWIVVLLKKHSIPFQISGGFASRFEMVNTFQSSLNTLGVH